jgi:hypothetical protein
MVERLACAIAELVVSGTLPLTEEQRRPELREGLGHEFGKDAGIPVDRIKLDMHRKFVAGPFGLTINLDELFRSNTRR